MNAEELIKESDKVNKASDWYKDLAEIQREIADMGEVEDE